MKTRNEPTIRTSRQHVVVLVTVPNLTLARKLARAVLSDRLAACANIVPGVESHYWWQGKLECGRELLMVLKTTRNRLEPLEEVVRINHPYDTPEFVVLPLTAGSRRYLDWLDASVRS